MNLSEGVGNLTILNSTNASLLVTQNPAKTYVMKTSFVILFIIVTIVFMSDMVTLCAMKLTKRIPFAVKILTMVTLSCDCVFMACVICWLPLQAILQDVNRLTAAIMVEVIRLSIAISYTSVSTVLVERVICFSSPNFYNRHFSKRVSRIVIICVIGFTVSVKIIVRYVIIPLTKAEHVTFVSLSGDTAILFSQLCICLPICIGCYISMTHTVRKVRNVMPQNGYNPHALPYQRSIKTVYVIFAGFVVVHLPLFFVSLWRITIDSTLDTRYAHVVAQFIVCAVNPGLYAWRFNECKLIMYQVLGKVSDFFRSKGERLRLEIYNIVISDSRSP